MRLLDLQRVHQRDDVGAERLEGVAAGRVFGKAVAAPGIGQQAERVLQVGDLLVHMCRLVASEVEKISHGALSGPVTS